MSPRRSSRARVTQHLHTAPGQTNSSNSSVSSGRQERSTRSSNKQTSPRLSNPRSQSLDDIDDTRPPPRRTRSGHEDTKELLKNDNEEDNEEREEEEAEEGEVTRCVCGQPDYPGLPAPVQELLKQQAKHPDAKYEAEAINDDLGGLFVQCDICKVWQHGGCVGIFDEVAANRDDYFCEQCRKDLHKISTAPNGTRYSTYLPLKEEASPTGSPEPFPRDRSRRNDARKRDLLQPPKRRSTMNSREIYDEAEEFRRAIEESKRDAIPGEPVRRKRVRDETEEQKPLVKRQRTGSKSDSPEATNAATSSSDEALAVKSAEHITKKSIRGAAARNHAAKELREQKERERLKAADLRKSRMEKRRGDESDNADEPQPTPRSAISSPPVPDSATSRPSAKKIAKPTSKSTKRTGRNQYTKDRDVPASGLSNSLDPNAGDTRASRGRSRSRSAVRDLGSPHGGGPPNGGVGDNSSRLSKLKHLNPNRTSMNEMKKRIAAIMEYVNRAEDEMNRQSSVNNAAPHDSSSSTTTDSTSNSLLDDYKTAAGIGSEIDFGALNSKEMVKVLKARLVAWEDEYGRYPR